MATERDGSSIERARTDGSLSRAYKSDGANGPILTVGRPEASLFHIVPAGFMQPRIFPNGSCPGQHGVKPGMPLP